MPQPTRLSPYVDFSNPYYIRPELRTQGDYGKRSSISTKRQLNRFAPYTQFTHCKKDVPAKPLVCVEENPGPVSKADILTIKKSLIQMNQGNKNKTKNKNNNNNSSNLTKGSNKRGNQKKSNMTGSSINVTNSLGQVTVTGRAGNLVRPVTITKSECLSGGLFSPSSGSTDLLKTVTIEPTNKDMFPWLSTEVTGKFEQYSFRKLSFRYEPIVGSQTNGRIGLNFNFDPTETESGEVSSSSGIIRAAILNSSNTIVSNIGNSVILDIATENFLHKKYLIRDPHSSSSLTPTNFSVGSLNALVYGVLFGSGLNLGDIFVDYTIDLHIPVSDSIRKILPYNNSLDSFFHQLSTSVVGPHPMEFVRDRTVGTGSAVQVARSTNGVELLGTTPTNTSVLMPVGTYIITYTGRAVSDVTSVYQYAFEMHLANSDGTSDFFIQNHNQATTTTLYSQEQYITCTFPFTVFHDTTLTTYIRLNMTTSTVYISGMLSVLRL